MIRLTIERTPELEQGIAKVVQRAALVVAAAVDRRDRRGEEVWYITASLQSNNNGDMSYHCSSIQGDGGHELVLARVAAYGKKGELHVFEIHPTIHEAFLSKKDFDDLFRAPFDAIAVKGLDSLLALEGATTSHDNWHEVKVTPYPSNRVVAYVEGGNLMGAWADDPTVEVIKYDQDDITDNYVPPPIDLDTVKSTMHVVL